MSTEFNRAPTLSFSAVRLRDQDLRIAADLRVVCLWSFLGLDLCALALVLGLGTEMADILGRAG